MRDNCYTLLRYLFALGIFLGHVLVCTDSGRLPVNPLLLVGGFFAMSGLLCYRSYASRPEPLRFLRRRARRILPAYLLTVLLCFLLGCCMTDCPLADFLQSGQTWRYLLCNAVMLGGLQPTLPGVFTAQPLPDMNAALWTMKIEVGFYLTVPLVWWLCARAEAKSDLSNTIARHIARPQPPCFRRFRVAWPLPLVVSLSLLCNWTVSLAASLTGSQSFHTMQHQLPALLCYFYLPVLLYGWDGRKMAFPGTITQPDRATAHTSILYRMSVILAAAAVVGYSLCWQLRYLLPLAVPVLVVWIGQRWTLRLPDITYEFYLLHFPVVQTIVCMRLASTPGGVTLIALPLTLLAAWALHRVLN